MYAYMYVCMYVCVKGTGTTAGMFSSCNASRNSSRTWKDGISSSTPKLTFAWCIRMGSRSLCKRIRSTIGFLYCCCCRRRRRYCCFCCCCCVGTIHDSSLNALSLRWCIRCLKACIKAGDNPINDHEKHIRWCV